MFSNCRLKLDRFPRIRNSTSDFKELYSGFNGGFHFHLPNIGVEIRQPKTKVLGLTLRTEYKAFLQNREEVLRFFKTHDIDPKARTIDGEKLFFLASDCSSYIEDPFSLGCGKTNCVYHKRY